MKVKITKKAVIRSNVARQCPYGLSVPNACKCVGKAIYQMAPLGAVKDEEKQATLKKANGLIYLYNKKKAPCPFADKILDEFDKVDCDWSDTGEGENSIPLAGSPLYPRTFSGIGADTLQSLPLGFYADHLPSRNLFYGLFSFLGSNEIKEIIKLANEYDECGEKEGADRIDNLLDEIEKIRNEKDFQEALYKIEDILSEYKQKYQDTRKDTGIMNELAEKWWGPRQVPRS